MSNTYAPTNDQRDASEDDGLIAKFNKWDSALNAHWSDWREEARVNFGMVAGHQVDKKTREDAEESGVAYVTINRIDSTISAICGSQINGRQEVKYFPREMSSREPVIDEQTGQPKMGPDGQPLMGPPTDAKVNEILTGAAEWARQECDADEEESQAFRDCIICGVGVTETRMDYEEDAEGMPKIERIDPLEIGIDPAARRPNAMDARYLRRRKRFSKDEAADRFGIDVAAYSEEPSPRGPSHENYPGSPYDPDKVTDEAPLGKDQVEIDEYQWFDLVKAYAVADPRTQEVQTLDADQFEKLQAAGLKLQYQTIRKRRYRRAWRIGSQMLDVADLPDDEFTWKVITGKLDRNKGVWYGVVRAMVDPQRLVNKMVSQVQRIIDHTAKGGLLAEMDAFEDWRQAEDDWARSDSIVWLKNGSISGGNPKVIPKPVGQYPSAIDKLFAVMDDAVPGVSGVNKEMLGLQQGTDQAGVLDYQRKQAAYAVLACFFDNMRRYYKQEGRHLLKLITKYMSDGRLIRIVGRQGNVQYLPLVRQADTAKYDVIVDEAPAGPNQKERTFAFLQSPFGAQVMAEAPPEVQLKLLEFTPLPASLVSEIQQVAAELPPKQDPAMVKAQNDAQMKQMQAQLDMQQAQHEAQLSAQKAQTDLMLEQQKLQATREKMAADLETQRQQAAVKLQIMQEESDNKIRLAVEQMQADMKLAIMQMQLDHQVALKQVEADKEIGHAKARANGKTAPTVDTDVNGQ